MYSLRRVPLLRDNKKPSASFIYHYIFGEVEDSFIHNLPAYIEDIEDEENIIVEEFDTLGLCKFIINYCKWISKELSENLIVSRYQVSNKIDELLEL